MKIEAIPGFAANFYSWIAKNSPIIRDIHRNIAAEVCSQVSAGRILDIGTGPGYVPFEIAVKAPQLEIVGVDLSPKMVAIAARDATKRGLSGRVKFQFGNASKLPFDGESFDVVISSLSLHHWAHLPECFSEVHRVLKKGGRALIFDIQKDTAVEVDDAIRTKYGRFLAFLFLTVVRSHSSLKTADAQKMLNEMAGSFSRKNVQTQNAILCLQLVK